MPSTAAQSVIPSQEVNNMQPGGSGVTNVGEQMGRANEDLGQEPTSKQSIDDVSTIVNTMPSITSRYTMESQVRNDIQEMGDGPANHGEYIEQGNKDLGKGSTTGQTTSDIFNRANTILSTNEKSDMPERENSDIKQGGPGSANNGEQVAQDNEDLSHDSTTGQTAGDLIDTANTTPSSTTKPGMPSQGSSDIQLREAGTANDGEWLEQGNDGSIQGSEARETTNDVFETANTISTTTEKYRMSSQEKNDIQLGGSGSLSGEKETDQGNERFQQDSITTKTTSDPFKTANTLPSTIANFDTSSRESNGEQIRQSNTDLFQESINGQTTRSLLQRANTIPYTKAKPGMSSQEPNDIPQDVSDTESIGKSAGQGSDGLGQGLSSGQTTNDLLNIANIKEYTTAKSDMPSQENNDMIPGGAGIVGGGAMMGNPAGEPMGEPMEEPIGEPVGGSMEEKMGEPMGTPIGEPIGESVGEPIEQSNEGLSQDSSTQQTTILRNSMPSITSEVVTSNSTLTSTTSKMSKIFTTTSTGTHIKILKIWLHK